MAAADGAPSAMQPRGTGGVLGERKRSTSGSARSIMGDGLRTSNLRSKNEKTSDTATEAQQG